MALRDVAIGAALLFAGSTSAVAQVPPAHDHPAEATPEALRALEPAALPDHRATKPVGAWTVRVHGFGVLGVSGSTGGRGVREGFGTNMLMASASRRWWGGIVTTAGAMSLEPLMGPRGYALLLQSGETADDVLPLRDRQHPHDLLSEWSVSYRGDPAPDRSVFVSAAIVGAPAFGPAPFMHRASASENPEAPLGHHYLDSLHISNGVVSGGVRAGPVTIDASAFNGIEPDPRRWAVDRVRIDSYAMRVRLDPHPSVVFQASLADLAQPDRLHPTIGVVKASFSASVHRPTRHGTFDATVAVGRNKSKRAVIPLVDAQRTFSAPVLAHYVSLADLTNVAADAVYLVFPPRAKSGWLIEGTLRRRRTAYFARVEGLGRDELFDPSDVRHSEVFAIGKAGAGMTQTIWETRAAAFDLGWVANIHRLPAAIRPDYGSRPVSLTVFGRIDLGHATAR